ncbi:hypothetical protein PG990_011440 [Apiospora arundinis]
MSSLAETSKAIRGRARNLSIKTATSNISSLHSSESDDTFSTGSFVHVSKPSSATAEPGSKKIEALLNTDWRTNRRPRAETFNDPPKTAILPNPKSPLKPVLRVDTSRVTCDRIRDTPIDAEFIHSAPATKKEFANADDAENHGTGEPEELQANFNSSFAVRTDLSDWMSLSARIREHLTRPHSSDDSTGFPPAVIKVTPVDCSPNGLQSPVFPLARMEKNLDALIEESPNANADQAVLQDPAICSIKVASKQSPKSPPREAPAEETRYNALIAKLNRRGTSESAGDVAKPRHNTFHGESGGPRGADSSKTASTLNPMASEYNPEFSKQHAATFSQPSAPKAGRPSVLDFFGSNKETPHVSDLNPSALDDLRAWGRVFLELLDSISQDEDEKEKIMSSLGDGRFPSGLLPPAAVQPNSVNMQQPPCEWPVPQSTQLPPSMQPVAGYGESMPSVPMGPYNDINAHLLAARDIFPEVQALGNLGLQAPVMPPLIGMQTNMQPNAPFAPQPSVPRLPMGQPPIQGTNRQAPNLPQQPGTGGNQGNGVAYPHGFGPTPVSKPKGAPRPGDPRWCKQQLMYEAYLEWQRSTDTNYHKKCKDRQAKRAERQRGSKDRQKSELEMSPNEVVAEVSA